MYVLRVVKMETRKRLRLKDHGKPQGGRRLPFLFLIPTKCLRPRDTSRHPVRTDRRPPRADQLRPEPGRLARFLMQRGRFGWGTALCPMPLTGASRSAPIGRSRRRAVRHESWCSGSTFAGNGRPALWGRTPHTVIMMFLTLLDSSGITATVDLRGGFLAPPELDSGPGLRAKRPRKPAKARRDQRQRNAALLSATEATGISLPGGLFALWPGQGL
jgi:hypothetical protein